MDYTRTFGVLALALWIITGVDSRVFKGRGIDKYVTFGQNYVVTWGQSHVSTLHSGQEVDLYMDQSSGGGFESKNSYGSGLFQIRIKVPGGNTGGIVTAFYLTSKGGGHDEIDFEFLGNNNGKPVTLQTNLFLNGEGNREERFTLWFNPTKHYHTYGILWNPYQIVFYVDYIPIRVYKNENGVSYPTKPMQVEASLWNGDDWATDGGRTKVNWSYSPFIAHFQDFSLSGCNIDGRSNNVGACASSNYWWNAGNYQRLNGPEQSMYENFRNKYMNYDYCTDRSKYQTPPRECY
ncbi:PREDICTED: xyloglucan endotransglucosylase/hydrolase protein 3-like [Camelina sativa]|uniref:Xyloglucan endotransglucosylase/hydrolase n=1 Tax=Camelina sativa TaxID=90675 RepID=A0ABM0ZCH8_CAMSA|nr:PREDICTED: xyloglucan endotransglucosylase/hydrolase protein 3-like [Camelina sativa]